MQAAAKQFVQVRIVHLDHIERRGDAAVTLWDDPAPGHPAPVGLDLRGLGFLAAQVKRVFSIYPIVKSLYFTAPMPYMKFLFIFFKV